MCTYDKSYHKQVLNVVAVQFCASWRNFSKRHCQRNACKQLVAAAK